MVFVERQRDFAHHGERIHRGVGLDHHLDPRVVAGKDGAQDIAALDQFAMPAVAPEGFFDGEDLAGWRAHAGRWWMVDGR